MQQCPVKAKKKFMKRFLLLFFFLLNDMILPSVFLVCKMQNTDKY